MFLVIELILFIIFLLIFLLNRELRIVNRYVEAILDGGITTSGYGSLKKQLVIAPRFINRITRKIYDNLQSVSHQIKLQDVVQYKGRINFSRDIFELPERESFSSVSSVLVQLSPCTFEVKPPSFITENVHKVFNQKLSSFSNYGTFFIVLDFQGLPEHCCVITDFLNKQAIKQLYPKIFPNKDQFNKGTFIKKTSSLFEDIYNLGVRDCYIEKRNISKNLELSLVGVFKQPVLNKVKTVGALKASFEDLKKIFSFSTNFVELSGSVKRLSSTSELQRKSFQHFSHDIRSPLNSITLALQYLSSQVEAEQESAEVAESALVGARQLSSMLEELLEFIRLGSNTISPKPMPFNLKDEIERVISIKRLVAEEKGLSIDFNNSNDVVVFADKKHVYRILDNIISNAIKYTTCGGVDISMVSEYDRISCVISDTGRGISEQALELIFEPFVRADFTDRDSKKTKGVGLGLSLVKQLAEINDITLSVDSKVGEGSSFKLGFPVEI